jgi:hypothetical protein
VTSTREIRCYDYVNHRYEEVRDALRGDAAKVFQAATHAASSRAESVAAALRVQVAGLELSKDVVITVRGVTEVRQARRSKTGPGPVTRIRLVWEAARTPRLFPLMEAELAIYSLTATETQLDFLGRYRPPLGALGRAMNAIAGHRIAEVSVHGFLNDVAAYLRHTLEKTRA